MDLYTDRRAIWRNLPNFPGLGIACEGDDCLEFGVVWEVTKASEQCCGTLRIDGIFALFGIFQDTTYAIAIG